MKSQRLSLELPTWHNFSVCLAEPDPPSGDQAGSESGGAGSGQKDPKQGGTAEPDPERKIQALTEEKDRHFRKAQEQETELNELRKFREETERAKLTEADRIKADNAAQTERITTLEADNRRLAIENAFLASNSVKWHDAAAALKLVDLSAVEVKDGVVTNPDVLKTAIETTAKANAWMVAGEEQPGGKKKAPPPKSGDAPNGGQPDPTKPDFAHLEKKFPALRHHRTY